MIKTKVSMDTHYKSRGKRSHMIYDRMKVQMKVDNHPAVQFGSAMCINLDLPCDDFSFRLTILELRLRVLCFEFFQRVFLSSTTC